MTFAEITARKLTTNIFIGVFYDICNTYRLLVFHLKKNKYFNLKLAAHYVWCSFVCIFLLYNARLGVVSRIDAIVKATNSFVKLE